MAGYKKEIRADELNQKVLQSFFFFHFNMTVVLCVYIGWSTVGIEKCDGNATKNILQPGCRIFFRILRKDCFFSGGGRGGEVFDRCPTKAHLQRTSATTDTVTALGSTPQSAAAFLSMGGSLPCSAAQPLHETDQRPAAIIPKAAKTAAEPLVENRIPPSPQAFPPRRPGAPRQPVKILQQPPCFSRRHPHIGFKC